MVQLWVNLPRAFKMTTPGYQTLQKEQIPQVQFSKDSYARVIAGELNGIRGRASTFTPVNLFDVRLAAGDTAELALPEGFNTAVLLLRGGVSLNGSKLIEGEAKLALLEPDGDTLRMEATADSILLVLNGEPIDEPVASYGPFRDEHQAGAAAGDGDYRAGKMGHLS
jgi:Pirin-related protein